MRLAGRWPGERAICPSTNRDAAAPPGAGASPRPPGQPRRDCSRPVPAAPPFACARPALRRTARPRQCLGSSGRDLRVEARLGRRAAPGRLPSFENEHANPTSLTRKRAIAAHSYPRPQTRALMAQYGSTDISPPRTVTLPLPTAQPMRHSNSSLCACAMIDSR